MQRWRNIHWLWWVSQLADSDSACADSDNLAPTDHGRLLLKNTTACYGEPDHPIFDPGDLDYARQSQRCPERRLQL